MCMLHVFEIQVIAILLQDKLGLKFSQLWHSWVSVPHRLLPAGCVQTLHINAMSQTLHWVCKEHTCPVTVKNCRPEGGLKLLLMTSGVLHHWYHWWYHTFRPNQCCRAAMLTRHIVGASSASIFKHCASHLFWKTICGERARCQHNSQEDVNWTHANLLPLLSLTVWLSAV